MIIFFNRDSSIKLALKEPQAGLGLIYQIAHSLYMLTMSLQ